MKEILVLFPFVVACGIVQPPPLQEDPIDLEDCFEVCGGEGVVKEASITRRKESSSHVAHQSKRDGLECICVDKKTTE